MLRIGTYAGEVQGDVAARRTGDGMGVKTDAAMAVAEATCAVAVEAGLVGGDATPGILELYAAELSGVAGARMAPDFLEFFAGIEGCGAGALDWGERLADAMVPAVPFCAFAGALLVTSANWTDSQPECGTLFAYLGGVPLAVDTESRSMMVGHFNPVAAVVLRDLAGKLLRSLRGGAPVVSAVMVDRKFWKERRAK